MYLKNWAHENKVYTYNLLVPHPDFPIWNEKSIDHSASIKNLYVRQETGQELDDFENEFMKKYETPATGPLQKACSNLQLSSADWHILIDFVAAQFVRTPAAYFRTQTFMKEMLPEIIEEVETEIRDLTPKQIMDQQRTVKKERVLLPITLDFTGVRSDDTHQYVEINAIAGKSTWLFLINQILSDSSSILHQHRWSIITAADDISWPTTDDPVICLNNDGSNYDFKGGWGKMGSEIIMPICPSKALYTQVGVKHPARMRLSKERSLFIKKLIVEHALMYIYSSEPDDDIPFIKPRITNPVEYKRIKTEYEEWYEKYIAEEVPFLSSRVPEKSKSPVKE